MKPQVLHRKRSIQYTLVAFRYDYTSSIGYVWGATEEEMGKQVIKFLSNPNNADVISIRRVYITPEEAEKMERKEKKKVDQSQATIQ